MPRGSKPGERRGGRQRGTPNKTTVLKDAVIAAAGTSSDASPLDFMLRLMRSPNLPTELRIDMAKSAAPLVHVRRRDKIVNQRKPTPERSASIPPWWVGPRVTFRLSSVPSKSSAQKMEAKLNATEPEGAADLSPLDYLLSVMNDAEAEPRLRIKAARIAAPYLHANALPHPDQMSLVIDDPFGFDPAVSAEIRDDVRRLGELSQEGLERTREREKADRERLKADRKRPIEDRDQQLRDSLKSHPEEDALKARIDARLKKVQCPASYGSEAAAKDSERIHLLNMKHMTPPNSSLSDAEVTEKAHLEMRVGVYNRRRLEELESRSSAGGLSASEESELEGLRERDAASSKPPVSPEDQLRAIREYNEKMVAEIRQRVAEKLAPQKSVSASTRPATTRWCCRTAVLT